MDDATDEDISLAKTAFIPSSTSLSCILPGQAILDRSALDRSIGDIVNRYLRDREASKSIMLLQILVSHVSHGSPRHVEGQYRRSSHIFRSYSTAEPPSQLTVREVALATTAAAPLFSPAKLRNPPVKYIDAGPAGSITQDCPRRSR